jgi:hypothetical protein
MDWKKKYTVIGFYADTQETYVGHVLAHSAEQAYDTVISDIIECDDFVVIEVFEGHLFSALD